MNVIKTRVLALVLGGWSVAGFVPHVAAETGTEGREAVTKQCIARADREYPNPSTAMTNEWNDEGLVKLIERTAVYKECMLEKQQMP
jgi:hypothetical protein